MYGEKIIYGEKNPRTSFRPLMAKSQHWRTEDRDGSLPPASACPKTRADWHAN